MTRALEIRGARAGDASAIAAVHGASWTATYGSAAGRPSPAGRTRTWAERIAGRVPDEQLLVAVLAGEVVGFVWAGPSPDADDDPAQVAQVRSVHVDPQVQGRGIGRALLAEVAGRCAAAGRGQLSLWVVDSNAAARGFYGRLGWRRDGSRRRERLAMPGEDGPVVTVVRYRHDGTGRGEA